MKLHKLATLFPEITGDAFKALALDIKSRGLRHKITTLDGKILDGVNRHRACISSGVEPEFEEYDGDDPLAFVLGENLNRRHLTDSQRAAIAAKIATAKPGGDREHIANPANEALTITVLDEPGQGGACHQYSIRWKNERDDTEPHTFIGFQDGPIGEVGVNGITQEALLAIVIDRLRGFQSGEFKCRENAIALTHCEDALLWLQKRTRDRLARGVEGTNQK